MKKTYNDARWREIPGIPGYWVSDDYRIFSFYSNKVLFTWYNNHHTLCVRLFIGTKQVTRSVNKLVREMFGEKDELHMPKMQEPIPGERPDSAGAGLQKRNTSRNAFGRFRSPGLPDGRGQDGGRGNDRQESTGVAQKEVIFLLIPKRDDQVWDAQFYMCGACAHAIKLRDVEEHARDEHGASSAKLYSTAEEANNARGETDEVPEAG